MSVAVYAPDTEMSFTRALKRPEDRPSELGITIMRASQSRAAEDTPTEPAPAVHSYYAPKFPPDPKLPEVDEAMLEELELTGEHEYPSGVFRTAPVLKHVYRRADSERGAKSA